MKININFQFQKILKYDIIHTHFLNLVLFFNKFDIISQQNTKYEAL